MKNSKLSKKQILASLPILLIPVIILTYFFSWRPSDNDYNIASQVLKVIDSSYKTLAVEISSIQFAGDITAATPIKLEVITNTFNKSIDGLNDSAPFSRDFAVKAAYDQHRSEIERYKQSVNQLTSAIKRYMEARTACSAYTNEFSRDSEKSYTDLLSECKSALGEAKKSEHQEFNNQFLTDYLRLTDEYITTLDDWVMSEDESTDGATKEKITKLAQEISDKGKISLNLKLSNITEPIRDLDAKVESQKKAFLR